MKKLLEKDAVFDFNEECIKAFESLKEKLTNAPIMVSPNWSQPFELMCDASDFVVGAVLGQREGNRLRPIHFTSKTLNNAQQNYTVTKKELLAVQDAKPRLIRWILLLQEFDIEIKNKKGAENVTAYHLSRLENPNLVELRDEDIDDNFLGETLINVSSNDEGGAPWMIRICVYGSETQKILDECHHGPTGGHYGPSTTTKKVFDADFYWPTILKRLILSFKTVMLANVLVAFHVEMRCLKTASKSVKYSIYGESISWDHSLNPISLNTFSMPLITCPNGHKLKPYPPTMHEL
ncbi:reverse transcriptase domain-containing protein [Tanacetum coccineum]